MKHLVFMLLLSGLYSLAPAQTHQEKESISALVSGKLLLQDSNRPAVLALLLVKTESGQIIAKAQTDNTGNFRVGDLAAGRYHLSFQLSGYQPLYKPISISKASLIDLGILFLLPDIALLKEVTIHAEPPLVSLRLDKKTYFSGKDVFAQNGAVSDLLNGIPAVSVDPAGVISLRGNNNVNVLINGRKTGMIQGNALDQIAADQIEKIEVITNPSARYDAAGSAGIINIVMKKNKELGFSGQIKLVGGLPNDSRISPSINYKSTRVNLFSTFGYRNSDYKGLYTSSQSANLPGFSAEISSVKKEKRHDDAKNIYLGADFYLNTQNTFTLAFFKNPTHDRDQSGLDYIYSAANGGRDSTLNRQAGSTEHRDYNQFEFNYTRTFKAPEKKWTIDLLYDFWKSNKTWNLETQKTFPQNNVLPNIRSNSEGSSKDLVLQTDFIQPLKSGKTIETGLKIENRAVNSDFLAEQQNEMNWLVYRGVNNQLKYNEKIAAAYLQFAHQFKKFSYMIGFRTEFTDITVQDKAKSYLHQKRGSRLFPTLNLGYQFKEGQTLQWSYSKRINRPSLYLLYPFTELTDLNYQVMGNPNLNPAYADVFELGFLHTTRTFTFNPSAYVQHTSNYIQNFNYSDENEVIISTPFNLQSENRAGFALSFRSTPRPWLQLGAESNWYQFKQKGSYDGHNFNCSGRSFTSRISVQVKLPEQFMIQGRYNITGAQRNAQQVIKAIGYADFGLNKTLLKNKVTLTLDGMNIFNSRQTRTLTSGEGYRLDQVSNFNAARYRLSFVYRVNLSSEKLIRQAKSGNRN